MTILNHKRKMCGLKKLSFVAASFLSVVLASPAADRYWDTTDSSAPLVGSGSTLNLSGSYFSTSAAGDTALTTMGTGNDIYFQTDTIQAYTVSVDVASAQTNGSFTVSGGNDVTLAASAGRITVTNSIVITGGSKMRWSLSSTAKSVFYTGNNSINDPDLVFGAGDNTLEVSGWGSDAFWAGQISGDAGDRIVVVGSASLYLCYRANSVFGGELVGNITYLPQAKLTLTGDSPDVNFNMLNCNLQLGNGGTSGSIGGLTTIVGGNLYFNRSDDVVFTNAFNVTKNRPTDGGMGFHNDGTGHVTITSDITGASLTFYGDGGTLSGDTHTWRRLMHEGTGTWILSGSNTIDYTSTFEKGLWLRNGGTLQIGDGTASASLSMTNALNYAVFEDTSSLAMDLRGGALLEIGGDLQAGYGTSNYLKIIGDGQETPIITFGTMSLPFDGVVYYGVTNTWAGAQIPGALKAPVGRTQMRIEGNSIYIDPLPPAGTVLIIR